MTEPARNPMPPGGDAAADGRAVRRLGVIILTIIVLLCALRDPTLAVVLLVMFGGILAGPKSKPGRRIPRADPRPW